MSDWYLHNIEVKKFRLLSNNTRRSTSFSQSLAHDVGRVHIVDYDSLRGSTRRENLKEAYICPWQVMEEDIRGDG